MEWFSSLQPWLQSLLATIFTYGMTAAGAALVFFSKKFNQRVLTVMMGLAGGIMIAASFFSLLMPAIENCESTGRSPAPILTVVFLAGGAFIVVSDIVMNRMNTFKNARSKSGFLLTAAVTLHNIPEGLAVGVAFGSVVAGTQSSLIAAVMLAVGIGIQNFPEGLCISLPLRNQGMSIGKAFFIGQMSGAVEIVAGIIGVFAVAAVSALLPWALAFSAGAMIAVVCSELIPASFAESKSSASIGVMLGFALMMFLDVFLG